MEALLDRSILLYIESNSVLFDIKSNYTVAVNKLLESRRATPMAREATGVSLMQLSTAVVFACDAFWVGMSDEQHCEARYRRGIAIEHRADYESRRGPTPKRYLPKVQDDTPTKPIYDDAAKELYFASQLSPNDSMIKAALARVDARLGRVTDQRNAPMIRVRMASGATLGR